METTVSVEYKSNGIYLETITTTVTVDTQKTTLNDLRAIKKAKQAALIEMEKKQIEAGEYLQKVLNESQDEIEKAQKEIDEAIAKGVEEEGGPTDATING